jgi:nucleoid-associated protein YgaU
MNIKVSSIFLALALSLTCVLASHADELLKNDYPERYIVKKGDTLWGISSSFLNSPWLWPEIWQANPQIDNPHLIFPGDVVSLVYIDGKPRLTVNRTVRLTPQGTDKLSPQIRESALEEAIASIPLDEINSWLLQNRVLESGVLEAAPYVLLGQEGRLILGAGDRLYGRGEFADNIPSYGIYRKGADYLDPKTGELLGIQAIDIGNANIQALEDDIGTFSVTRSTGDIRIGDRILPTVERIIETSFFPSAPRNEVEGVIINLERGVNQVALLDVVAINRGESDSLIPGNVLAIYKRGMVTVDKMSKSEKNQLITLPEERAGLLMVFQTFEKMSLALVLKADRGIKVGDFVRLP